MLCGPVSEPPAPGAKRVVVSGAAGRVSAALLPRLSSGEVFGPGTPLELVLLESAGAPREALRGILMELEDCAFPLLRAVSIARGCNDDAFVDADVAVLIGGARHGQGMVRADLLQANAQIFADQGRAIGDAARRGVQVLVIANPVNTNALIAAQHAPALDPWQFTALTRIDQNRAMSQVTAKTGVAVADVERVAIWGNHSAAMYPDLSHALVAGKPALSVINDPIWVRSSFKSAVQTRAEDIIRVRGNSSAFSAASAAVDHLRDLYGTPSDAWRTMAVHSDGSYGIDEGIWFSVPCTCGNGSYRRVLDLALPDDVAASFAQNCKELASERDAASQILPSM
jgi:malate dehydrogenase